MNIKLSIATAFAAATLITVAASASPFIYGTWKTSYGNMHLRQSGNELSGDYLGGAGRLVLHRKAPDGSASGRRAAPSIPATSR